VRYAGGAILLPEDGGMRLGYGVLKALGAECACECLLWDEAKRRLTAMGLRALRHGNGQLTFAAQVDVEYSTDTGEGAIYAQATQRPENSYGFALGPWGPVGDQGWKTHASYRAPFSKIQDRKGKVEDEA
jgi:hypothetical protein